jgi:hypothetical protein
MMIPIAYGLTRNWRVVIEVEAVIVAGGYAGDYALRKLRNLKW